MTKRQTNILDPIRDQLDPRVFDDPASPEPKLKPELQRWIIHTVFEVLQRHGYDNPDQWATLILTGSLTTYQYSDKSDVDISLFINSDRLPDWSRAELIAIMVSEMDERNLPGTSHPLQCYVVPPQIQPSDFYKPGLRSAYVVYGDGAGRWIVPPDRTHVHDVEKEMNDAYTVGLLAADKMDLLMRYEPEHAKQYWKEVHRRRMESEQKGEGDFTAANIAYKMLVNRFGEKPSFAT
jgi:hypothetical protein